MSLILLIVKILTREADQSVTTARVREQLKAVPTLSFVAYNDPLSCTPPCDTYN